MVYLHVSNLVAAGLSPSQISVISPYNLQVDAKHLVSDPDTSTWLFVQVHLLNLHVKPLFPGLSVRSVDGFQGQENEAVVLSLVRCNPKKIVGFLSDWRRLNVAVTRAKRHVAIIGDSATLISNPFLRRLHQHVALRGLSRSALEFTDQLSTLPFSIDTSQFTALPPSSKPKSGSPAPEQKKKTPTSATAKKNKSPSTPTSSSQTSTPSAVPSTASSVPIPADWETELRERITRFAEEKGGSGRLEMSPALRPHQRAFAHELAEQLRLIHHSCGDGAERRLVLEHPKEKESGQEKKEEIHPKTKPSAPQLSPKVGHYWACGRLHAQSFAGLPEAERE